MEASVALVDSRHRRECPAESSTRAVHCPPSVRLYPSGEACPGFQRRGCRDVPPAETQTPIADRPRLLGTRARGRYPSPCSHILSHVLPSATFSRGKGRSLRNLIVRYFGLKLIAVTISRADCRIRNARSPRELRSVPSPGTLDHSVGNFSDIAYTEGIIPCRRGLAMRSELP